MKCPDILNFITSAMLPLYAITIKKLNEFEQSLLGVENRSTAFALVPFFSQPFNENSKFLKNCPYYSNGVFYSHSTPY